MLQLDNAPQAKVRTDCFSASLWVCLAFHTERCIVIVIYLFQGERAFYSDVRFSNSNVLYIVLAVI